VGARVCAGVCVRVCGWVWVWGGVGSGCCTARFLHFQILVTNPAPALNPTPPALVSSAPPPSPSGVPAMSMQVRDQARRFITLIDEVRCGDEGGDWEIR